MPKDKNTKLYSELETTLVSTSKHVDVVSNKPINMYIITYKIGKRRYSQTRHMTAAQLKTYITEGIKHETLVIKRKVSKK